MALVAVYVYAYNKRKKGMYIGAVHASLLIGSYMA